MTAETAKALLCLLDATRDIDKQGFKVCRICHGSKRDHPRTGHAPGCDIDRALKSLLKPALKKLLKNVKLPGP